ncbi:MAG: CBS domain-containing protein [Ktedonobacteraceae bacterium]
MFYLSQLLGIAVEDSQGTRIGKLIDVLTLAEQVGRPAPVYPSVVLVEGQEDSPWRVPVPEVAWDDGTVRVSTLATQFALQPETSSDREVSFAHDVLDKQVINIGRKKTVRVNDIAFDDDWRIVGVDNTNMGLFRRLAPGWLSSIGGGTNPASLIPWEHINLIESPQYDERELDEVDNETPSQKMHRVQSGQLSELHPADIAEIVHQLTPGQGARLIEGLDNETAADTMEEIDTERQRLILENIQPDRAADILDAMGPDEAADLLSLLPEERAQELLKLMQPEESEEVQDLLEYDEDSAGGLMTTDYIALNATKTVADAIEAVRVAMLEEARQAYVYCVPDETADEYRLLGIVSLWDLLIAPLTQSLQDLMETDMTTVKPDTDSRTVAQTMAKYNLFAIPVVNDQGYLEGVVTVDDALDVLLPNDKKRRPTRMY